MKVLIGCEESGIMRRAFAMRGHDAWSCDLKPARDRSNKHLIGDVREFLHMGWDLLMVAHPPCTRLCNSGVRWLTNAPPKKLNPEHHTAEEIEAYKYMTENERMAFMWKKLDEGAQLFSDLWNAPIERKAIENPVMHPYAMERILNYKEPDQTVQPWWFGDPFFKATSWWLENLPPLEEGENSLRAIVPKKELEPERHAEWSAIHRASPGKNRSEIRSTFFPGMADACAETWGGEAMRMAA